MFATNKKNIGHSNLSMSIRAAFATSATAQDPFATQRRLYQEKKRKISLRVSNGMNDTNKGEIFLALTL
jgi:hypothetical protein